MSTQQHTTKQATLRMADEIELGADNTSGGSKKHASSTVDKGTDSSAIKTDSTTNPKKPAAKGTTTTFFDKIDDDIVDLDNEIKGDFDKVFKGDAITRDLGITVAVLSAAVIALGIAMLIFALRHKKSHGKYFPAAPKPVPQRSPMFRAASSPIPFATAPAM